MTGGVTAGHSEGVRQAALREDSSADTLSLWSERAQTGRRAALVGLSYYVGAHAGFLLVTASAPQSVLWLPNAILLAALMSSEPRRWMPTIVACFPAQLLVAAQTQSPLSTMALLFVTNVLDAALGGAVWWHCTRGERSGWNLRTMLLFITVVAIVPTVSVSFADAGVAVVTEWAPDYWPAFLTRARANVLTNIVLVPGALALFERGTGALAAAWQARWREVVLLLVGLTAAQVIAITRLPASLAPLALAYLALPFLLWAALRFGVGMTSTALLVFALVTTWLATHGFLEFGAPLTADTVVLMQSRILAVAISMLCLAAVVADRQETANALSESQQALHRSLDEISDLAGRLITTAEAERARIARELHDDVNQQIAALSIGLSTIMWRVSESGSLCREVAALQRQCMSIAEGVRALSHELHPAVLRHAGLAPALRELCEQFTRRFAMRAEIVADIPDVSVPSDIALSLYRVAQEGMRNAARHSRAAVVRLRLALTDARIELTIEDDGCGFEVGSPRARAGLGLISIEERVRLARGEVRLTSSPGCGTRIRVRVPLSSHQRGDDEQHHATAGAARG